MNWYKNSYSEDDSSIANDYIGFASGSFQVFLLFQLNSIQLNFIPWLAKSIIVTQAVFSLTVVALKDRIFFKLFVTRDSLSFNLLNLLFHSISYLSRTSMILSSINIWVIYYSPVFIYPAFVRFHNSVLAMLLLIYEV